MAKHPTRLVLTFVLAASAAAVTLVRKRRLDAASEEFRHRYGPA